jgi:alpha-1,3-glucan synthase
MITGFDFGENYVPPTGFRKYCQVKFGTWPAYSFGLALGQIIASNSYQITLLTGEIGQSAEKLYSIAGIYLAASLFWLLLTRYVKLLYLLTVPFFFYGLAFLLVGTSPFVTDGNNRFWMQNVATGFYAFASASGSLFFAFNFGDEGGAPITIWIWRACWIQALQHAYTLALWFWGSFISSYSAAGKTSFRLSALPVLFPVTLVVALLLWTIGLVLFLGLPSYYRQMPDQVPSLLRSIVKRKITLWFFVAVLLQNYFLSAPYGRNWFFLFSSQHVSTGAVLGLAFGFLIGGWGVFLGWFAFISKRHPWWLPVFAIGLGAPRWAQMLWGTSSFGLFLPWAGSDVTSALVSRCLWLWLGLLDAIQNTGVGLILLLTLTRIHVSVTLMIAQVLGSVATIVARATAPNKLGPGDVFPDFSMGLGAGLGKAWFWVALLAQLMICVGYLKFFRKEQISKP